MKKHFDLGGVDIDLVDYGISGNAILGIRDSGKTYTATMLGEMLFDVGIPFIAFDPSGVWRFLRVPGHGRGRPVVVAGGKDGDLPLNTHSATAIVEAAMKNGISLVIDLYSADLSKADWRRIVRDSIKLLLHKNGPFGMRHLFIEEAAEFAPQRVYDGEVYAQVERLCRIGGNAGVGYTLINQRSQEVNKAVLELCGNLFLHRQRGKNALVNVEKWLDVGSVDTAKVIRQSLSTLPTGECWVWLSDSVEPVRVKVPRKDSFHPDRRALRGNRDLAKNRVDVGDFVKQLQETLPKLQQEAEANDPAKLQGTIRQLEKRIRELEAQIATAPPTLPPGLDSSMLDAQGCISELEREHEDSGRILSRLSSIIGAIDLTSILTPSAQIAPRPRVERKDIAPKARNPGVEDRPGVAADLPRGEEMILTACIQFPEGVTHEQLGVLTGYKKTSRTTYLKRLAHKGLINLDRGHAVVTDRGLGALPNIDPLPTGDALIQYWFAKLPAGERVILEYFIDAYPTRSLNVQEIVERSHYQKTSVTTYLKRLRARQLVVEDPGARGRYIASPNLF